MNSADPAIVPPGPEEVPTLASVAGAFSLAAGARVAGAAVAIGYLAGLVPGPLAAALGALGLVTLGRAILSDRATSAIGVVAFGVISLAAVAGALRWGTFSLDAIRGVQAVLGPTILVDPQEAAIGAGLAAGGGTVGLALWFSADRPSNLLAFAWSLFETELGAMVLATCFWGPAVVAPSGGDAGELAKDLGGWALVLLAIGVPAFALSFLLRRLPAVWSWVVLAVALAAAIAGVILIPSAVIR